MSARTAAALLVSVLLVGCGGAGGGAPPSTEADVVGTATSVEPYAAVTEDCVEPDPDADPDTAVSSDDQPVCTDPAAAPLGTVLVEEDPASESGDTKIVFTVTPDTAIWVDTQDGTAAGTFADVAVGNAVSGWTDGAIADSYPQQATAAAIVVQRG